MKDLNYHHLRQFREVAHEGNLTRASAKLNVSQSALSTQIRQLEERMGHALFDRVGRRLELTEAGRIALDHADRIFETGRHLIAALDQSSAILPPLRVGALSTLSRNFQIGFLSPLLGGEVEVVLRSGDAATLLEALRGLTLDVVLSTEPPRGTAASDFVSHRLAAQPVAIHGAPERLDHPTLADLLAAERFILPSETTIRTGFASLAERLGVSPRIVAEVDDMAMVRLLAREGAGLAIAPFIVVQDELSAGRLATAPFTLDIVESFHAITIKRSFPHPALPGLLSQGFAAPEPLS